MNYNNIRNRLRKIITPDSVFVCIGTNRVIFDIFGPLCGDYLKAKNIPYFGDCNNNVNAVNMNCRLKEIYEWRKVKNENIIAIDASVTTNINKVNKVEVNFDRGVKPGAGVGKRFPTVGANSILMYTLIKDDLNDVMESYRNDKGFQNDKADLIKIKENAKIIVDIIEEIYNEVRGINLI